MKSLALTGRKAIAVIVLALAICAPALADTIAATAPLADAVVASQPIDWVGAARTYLATPAMITALCSFLSAILPQGASGTPWGVVRMVIDFAAMNFGNARNARI
jgi:hypothetical protein